MRTISIITLFAFSFLLISCDPDVSGEDITLPEMTFAFVVSPDTPQLRIGDTLILESSINSNHGGVQLSDGEIILGENIGYHPDNPITSFDGFETCLEDVHFSIAYYHGDFTRNITAKPNYLSDFRTVPQTDSIRFKYGFVFKKKGTYQFTISPSFYESKKGKARTDGFFDVVDPHWYFYQIPGEYPPNPSDHNYRKAYLVKVTE